MPGRYQNVGQPVLISGDMGRYPYVLVGTEQAMNVTFGSTCHGAERRMSRRTVREEISEAYRDVADMVEAMEGAGLSKKVARLRPLGVIKE